ncbi:MAG: hypothetical protein J0G99_00025 [Alphaproteobacteria bacterium]|nr:hypothetical protein [Alphaproteobacteria bacterium]
MMKHLVCAVLTFSLLGATAASARPWGGERHYDRGSHYGYSHDSWRGGRYHDGGAGLALGVGLGLFALAAIASQNDDHYYDYGPPPPPPPAYRGGYYGY